MSKSHLTRQDIINILYDIGVPKIQDKYVYSEKPNIQITCPVHGESTPSMGVNVDTLQTHCFACHFKGNLTWLVYNARKDDFRGISEVNEWIYRKYGVDLDEQARQEETFVNKQLIRYEDVKDDTEQEKTRKVLPRSYLAPFKSGKETFKYFFKRGFTKETMEKFKIGRDISEKLVTVPIYWEDEQLAGIIGRYIDKNRPKNSSTKETMEKFKIGRDISEKLVTVPIYWEDEQLAGIIGRYIDKNRPKNSRYAVREVPKAEITFPQNHLEVIDDTIIIVEGLLDALWLHQLGFTNAQSILGNEMSYQQRDFLKSKASKFVVMTDGDTGGETASDRIHRLLKGYTLYTVEYPEGKKDAQECTLDEIQEMLDNKTTKLTKKIRRY